MVDRRFIGDVMLAVLIAVPTAALARQDAAPTREDRTVQNAEMALAPAAVRQVGLFR